MSKLRSSKLLCALLVVAVVVTMMMPVGVFTVSASTTDEEIGEYVVPILPAEREPDEFTVTIGPDNSYLGELEGDFYYTVVDGEAAITAYVGEDVNVVIPETIGGYDVTALNDGAFYENETVQTVSMVSVKTIGTGAFKKCTALTTIEMPNVVTVGKEAFYYCIALRLNIPAGVTSIGDRAIFGCRSIDVDDENLYYTAFGGILYSKDKTVLIASSAGSWSSISLVSSVTTIYDYAFSNYTFKKVYVNNVTTIGYKSFAECNDITVMEMPKVTDIAECAFYSCDSLETVSMPSMTVIGKSVFEECRSLTNVDMPNVVTVGNSSFYNCRGLVSISMPSVTTLEFGAFDSCTSLTDIYMPNVTTLGRWAFNNCQSLVSVDMPSVTNIGGLAFGYCISLKTINVPNLTTVGIRAFAGSTLEAINLTNVTSIGKNAFDQCDSVVIYAPINSYAHQYAEANGINFVELSEEEIKSVSYEIENGKIIFTVTTSAGAYNRLKLTTADNLRGSIVTANSYTVNEVGCYVWTIKTNVPSETTNYAFDLRSSETGKYIKDYGYCEVEIIPIFKSVSYEIVKGKIIFTVTTSEGDYNRMKIADASKPSGSLAVSNSYTVNEDGDYVWTIRMNAPTQTGEYVFDLRSSETGKYIKERFAYTVEIVPSIKSVTYRETSTSLVFTVVTKSGDFNRLRCGLSESVVDNIKNVNSYTVNADGDYVWTIKITKPSENTTFYFDLRDGSTNKFIKDFFVFDYTLK